MSGFVHETANVKESDIKNAKLFRNVSVINSTFGEGCSIGDDTTVERCKFDNNVVINRRSYINDSEIGYFSYTGINTTMNWTKMGKFCSLARNVDIGGFDHDYRKITTMPEFRFQQLLSGGGKIPELFEHSEYCEIGNDVWIAAGAIVLHKVKIGDGAVIGAGAVVTHDIPPYAIAVGVPARIIGFRCDEKMISELLNIKWWDWDKEVIADNIDLLIKSDINQKTVEKIKLVNMKCNKD